MIKIVYGFFIFCLVLFLYLHIQFHLKKSDDLEMYELDYASKDKLEEICDLRQPVLFDFDCQKMIDVTNVSYLTSHYHAFDLKVRNYHHGKTQGSTSSPYSKTTPNSEQDSASSNEFHMPLPLHSTMKLLEEDKTSAYYTENNMDFLQETGIVKHIQYNDEFLRPYMVSNCHYDIMMGSQNTTTPFRYELNYRNYFLVTQGKVQVKMAPPKSSKYLYPIYDYENFEWRSPLNVWNIQPTYRADFDKIKCLEFTLVAGKTLYIPAYWWYSIQFQKDSCITCLKYRTYMNNLAVSPYILLYALQQQNIKRETTKKIKIQELNETMASSSSLPSSSSSPSTTFSESSESPP